MKDKFNLYVVAEVLAQKLSYQKRILQLTTPKLEKRLGAPFA